jgi:hypothetical protein
MATASEGGVVCLQADETAAAEYENGDVDERSTTGRGQPRGSGHGRFGCTWWSGAGGVHLRIVVSVDDPNAGHERQTVHDDDVGVLFHLLVDIDDLGRTGSLRHHQPGRFYLREQRGGRHH